MLQAPMMSCPLKQTSEIDWIQPLKSYIRQTYGDNPERYAEECLTLNRLRQDMRGAGKDSAAGRDLLYRYYGQLELLDLRFPIDENHIKISFTWFDAFTHKPTSQYSLAYEKASIIFNISAVLSCHAANRNRSEDLGLKTAYHSFQASAGMFTYINENFLHAPSTDLSRDTVKTLIAIMLAQGQEVFLEKQIADGKKVGMLAKLSSQAAYLYTQAVEGVQDNVSRAIFDKLWLYLTQVKANHMASLAQYYQALADDDANSHGTAIARLQVAEGQGKDASRLAAAFPSSVPPIANLSSETGSSLVEMTKRHLALVQEQLISINKDNDFIYHQTIPSEAALTVIPKLPAAKAIPVSELYQGQDIQRIIGPDIFQKIVPMSVTESASLYDEEKAKVVRAEAEKVETANGEMVASLDYLKLPGSLHVLKVGVDQETVVEEEFRGWCEELAGHEPFGIAFENLQADRAGVLNILGECARQLDREESVCEKMRSKYGADWTQQPSSRLTATLRGDIRSYRDAIDEAGGSDTQLFSTSRQHESDFDEMRSAGETDEADVLYQRAMVKASASRGRGRNGVDSPSLGSKEGNLLDEDYGEGGTSVADQIARIEDLLKKLQLIKRDRMQVLKDLKQKVQNDDISGVLILNKKSTPNHENQLFQAELEKFRPYQNRLLQANHKQTAMLKDLTKTYSDLLQDRRVRSEQARYESFTRQKNSVLSKYKKIFQAFNDLVSGLIRAQTFYSEMKDTVESLEKNVHSFVDNRRSEGAQLLNSIERDRANSNNIQADTERERLRELMERMSVDPSSSSSIPGRTKSAASQPSRTSHPSNQHASKSPPIAVPYEVSSTFREPSMYPSHSTSSAASSNSAYQAYAQKPLQVEGNNHNFMLRDSYGSVGGSLNQDPYNPMAYPYQMPGSSNAARSGHYSGAPYQGFPHHPQPSQYLPQGYVPPPPPPGPPPNAQHNFGNPALPYPAGPGGYAQYGPPRRNSSNQPSKLSDPWAGLDAWK